MLTPDDLRTLTAMIWDTVLGMPVNDPVPPIPPPGEELTGWVRIDGAWNGHLEVRFSPTLARRAAAAMFMQDPSEVADADVSDAIGEIANIAGGNIKAMLPEPCGLSTPTVGFGPGPAGQEGAEESSVDLQTEGNLVSVRLVGRAAG